MKKASRWPLKFVIVGGGGGGFKTLGGYSPPPPPPLKDPGKITGKLSHRPIMWREGADGGW